MTAQSDSLPIPASLRMASDVERRLREQQVGIFFVMPRVVRRVLQNELDIANPLQQPPHRKSCVIQRDRLLWLVARDELGVDDQAELPGQIILIAQPEEDQLEKDRLEKNQVKQDHLDKKANVNVSWSKSQQQSAVNAGLSGIDWTSLADKTD